MQATIAAPEKPRAGEEQRLALYVALTALVAVLLGWLLKVSVEQRTAGFNGLGGALTLRYPAGWVLGRAEDESTLLTVYDPRSAAAFNPTFTVRAQPMVQGQSLLDAATAWTLGRTAALREFHDLGTEQTFLAGRIAVRVHYAYIADPPPGSGPATLPIVARGADTLVVYGDQLLIFSGVADANDCEEYGPRFARIVASVRLAAK
jgi:hypothetical protein